MTRKAFRILILCGSDSLFCAILDRPDPLRVGDGRQGRQPAAIDLFEEATQERDVDLDAEIGLPYVLGAVVTHVDEGPSGYDQVAWIEFIDLRVWPSRG